MAESASFTQRQGRGTTRAAQTLPALDVLASAKRADQRRVVHSELHQIIAVPAVNHIDEYA